MERAARIGQLFFADENDKWAFNVLARERQGFPRGEAGTNL